MSCSVRSCRCRRINERTSVIPMYCLRCGNAQYCQMPPPLTTLSLTCAATVWISYCYDATPCHGHMPSCGTSPPSMHFQSINHHHQSWKSSLSVSHCHPAAAAAPAYIHIVPLIALIDLLTRATKAKTKDFQKQKAKMKNEDQLPTNPSLRKTQK